MAYRRRQGITRASTFKEEIHQPINNDGVSSPSSSSSLAAKAIRASNALRESSFSLDRHRSKEFVAYENASDSMSDSKSSFWGVLARKAKAILEDDIVSQQHEMPSSIRFNNSNQSQSNENENENVRKTDNRKFRKGLDAITTSLNHLGDTFEKAFEEGRTIVENKTADLIQETRKLQIKRQGNNNNSDMNNQADEYLNDPNPWHQTPVQPSPQPQTQTNHETQLKASRDVAMATAAKAKLLLRELKTVKADLAFAKERCSQLEEENKILRENRDKGDHRDDEDLIRLQLETLLAEKARLANENSIYARENRFLREIIEYHQLTMQDVMYLDESSEEVTEVYPISRPAGLSRMLSSSPRSSTSEDPVSAEKTPPETDENFSSENQAVEKTPPETEENLSTENQPREIAGVIPSSSDTSLTEEDTNRALASTN